MINKYIIALVLLAVTITGCTVQASDEYISAKSLEEPCTYPYEDRSELINGWHCNAWTACNGAGTVERLCMCGVERDIIIKDCGDILTVTGTVV